MTHIGDLCADIWDTAAGKLVTLAAAGYAAATIAFNVSADDGVKFIAEPFGSGETKIIPATSVFDKNVKSGWSRLLPTPPKDRDILDYSVLNPDETIDDFYIVLSGDDLEIFEMNGIDHVRFLKKRIGGNGIKAPDNDYAAADLPTGVAKDTLKKLEDYALKARNVVYTAWAAEPATHINGKLPALPGDLKDLGRERLTLPEKYR